MSLNKLQNIIINLCICLLAHYPTFAVQGSDGKIILEQQSFLLEVCVLISEDAGSCQLTILYLYREDTLAASDES